MNWEQAECVLDGHPEKQGDGRVEVFQINRQLWLVVQLDRDLERGWHASHPNPINYFIKLQCTPGQGRKIKAALETGKHWNCVRALIQKAIGGV